MNSHIEMYSQRFEVVKDKAGVEQVKLADLCATFGLDVASQRQRLEKTSWGTPVKITGVRSSGRKALFLAIPLRRVPMFFATLSLGHVAAEHREMLAAMQAEAADAVAAFYLDGGAVNPRATRTQLEGFADLINRLIRNEPATDPIWPDRFVRRYAAWHGIIWRKGDRHPLSMKNANGFFYAMVFPAEVLKVIRLEGVAAGVRYHQMLQDVPRNYLAQKLELATGIAEACRTEKLWRKTMARLHGKSTDDETSLELFS